MDAARRVVLLEGGMGVLWIALGALYDGVVGLRAAWWVALAAAVATAVVAYTDEHGLHGQDDWRRYAAAAAGVVGAAIALAFVVFVTDLAALTVVDAGIVGMGVGLLCYRFVYGVVRPVPQSRLDAARERAV